MTEDALNRLLSHFPPGRSAPEMLAPVVGECAQCRALLDKLCREIPAESVIEEEIEESAASSQELFERLGRRVRSWKARNVTERRDAPEAARVLLEMASPDRAEAIEAEERFRSLPLARLLCEASRVASFSDGDQALSLALLARDVADRLPVELYGPRVVADVRGMAWAFAANAYRVGADLEAAQQAFRWAHRLLRRGTGIPLAAVEVLDLEASLRREQHRFDEALALLERVVAIWETAGERRLAARVRILQGCVYREAGSSRQAVEPLRKALASLDSEGEAHLYAWAIQTLTLCHSESGEHRAARSVLPEARRLCTEQEDRLGLLQLRWIEGVLEPSSLESESALVEARRGFLALGEGYDAALISLDLAGLYTRRGAQAKLKLLANSLHPVLEALEPHQEAAATIRVFQQAVRLGAASAELVADLARHLRFARYQPTSAEVASS